jgi:tetratricopeptide (TPR) repeat protein
MALGLGAGVFALLLAASPLHALVPPDVEPRYGAAVLAFHAKDYNGSVRMLDEVLSRYPKQTEATELKALALKGLGRNAEAISLFKELIAHSKSEDSADSAYRFELGTLYYRQKSWNEAQTYLGHAIARKFNVEAARYLMGTIEYLKKDYARAERHFQLALGEPGNALKGPAHLYLAELSNLTNDQANTIFHYYRAKQLASEQLSDPAADAEGKDLAKQVVASVDRIVGTLDKPTLFGSLGILTGYDSNVLFTPADVASPSAGPSGRGSFRQFLTGELGYMTSPLQDFQFVPLYRASWNYNFNRSVAAGEFFLNDLSLLAAYKPLSKASFGVRLGAVGTFRYTTDPATGSQRYRTYNLIASVAPFVKLALGSRWSLIGSLSASPQRFFQDSETSALYFKSGAAYSAEVVLRQDRGHTLVNPMFALRGNLRYTKGQEFRGRGLELEAGNVFYISDKTSLVGFANVSTQSFTERPDGSRFDTALSLGGELSYRIASQVSLFGNVEYVKNNSNVEIPYAFSRLLLNVGATYRF